MEVKRTENYEVTDVVISMQNTILFEPAILTGFYTGTY